MLTFDEASKQRVLTVRNGVEVRTHPSDATRVLLVRRDVCDVREGLKAMWYGELPRYIAKSRERA